MSKSELIRFCNEYVPEHPELKQRVDAQGDTHRLAKGLALAGAEAGFGFSEDDILAVMSPTSAELSDGELEAVAGGRKAGGTQQEYMVYKLKEILIT
jgi:predicted ribosomally synthesized peptide with nif11-like leader